MSELDDLLMTLRSQPAPAGLEALDGPVMAGLARARVAAAEAGVSRRGIVLAGLVAVAVGTVATLTPSAPAYAEPLLGVPASAPSHLLAD
ncbi:MAG: hypothetical protein ABJA20_13750 [Novosphingobium sp.]